MGLASLLSVMYSLRLACILMSHVRIFCVTLIVQCSVEVGESSRLKRTVCKKGMLTGLPLSWNADSRWTSVASVQGWGGMWNGRAIGWDGLLCLVAARLKSSPDQLPLSRAS